MNRTRLDPKTRKQTILTAAVGLAKSYGYDRITREAVAIRAGVSAALVSKYFVTMEQLRAAVMGEAVRLEVVTIIAQGLVAGSTVAKGAPEALRRAAADELMR